MSRNHRIGRSVLAASVLALVAAACATTTEDGAGSGRAVSARPIAATATTEAEASEGTEAEGTAAEGTAAEGTGRGRHGRRRRRCRPRGAAGREPHHRRGRARPGRRPHLRPGGRLGQRLGAVSHQLCHVLLRADHGRVRSALHRHRVRRHRADAGRVVGGQRGLHDLDVQRPRRCHVPRRHAARRRRRGVQHQVLHGLAPDRRRAHADR